MGRTKINALKFSINYIIRLKCSNCKDKTFCKVKYYYEIMENPTSSDLDKLSKCIFYKKQKIS